MPDSSFARPTGPASWPDAFAAMPLDAAPADAWPAVVDRLPATRSYAPVRTRRIGWSAAAAVAIAAAGVVLLRPEPMAERVDRAIAPVAVAHRAAPAVTDARPIAAGGRTATASHAGAVPQLATPASTRGSTARLPTHDHVDVARLASRAPARPPTRRAGGAGTAADEVRIASTPNRDATASTTATAPTASTTSTASTAATLIDLRAESARLEALAALARDDRMGSAPAMVLAADAEDRVRLIDEALSRADLGEAQLLDLWTRRVAALRELAGVEGTNRWLAANGESLQGAIALVD